MHTRAFMLIYNIITFQFIDMKKTLSLGLIIVSFLSCNFIKNNEKEAALTPPTFDELIIKDVTATAMRWESKYLVKQRGDYTLLEHGFMYSTDPQIPVETAETDGLEYQTGYYNFSDDIVGLTPNTVYYGCLYCRTKEGKTFKGEAQTFQTHEEGDFSQVKILSPINDDVELGFLGCYRMDTKVLVEVTIKNIGIQDNKDFCLYCIGSGTTIDGRSYTSHIEDDVLTDYVASDVSYEMNGKVQSAQGVVQMGALPVEATKKLKISISGVPKTAKELDLYILSYFYNYSGCPHIYMQFEDVPIY